MDEALQLAAEGRCGILITDQALTQQALVQVGKQMRAYDPAAITIAVGSRGDDNALIGLLSSAVVERFMLKPVTPSLARLVIRSAASEYQSLKYRARRKSAAPPPQIPVEQSGEPVVVPMPVEANSSAPVPVDEPTRVAAAPITVEPRPQPAIDTARPSDAGRAWHVWLVAAVAALVVGTAVWWTMQSRMPDIDPRQVVATNLAAARQAFDEGRYVEPPESSALHFYGVVLSLDAANAEAKQGMEAVADRMFGDVKIAIGDGRLAEAGIALERLRRISADNRRLAALDSELRAEQASQLARLQSPPLASPEMRPAAAPAVSASKAPARKKAPVAVPMLKEEEPAVIPAAVAASSAMKASPLDMGPPAPAGDDASRAGAVSSTAAERAPIIVPAPVVTTPPPVEEPKLVKMVQPDFPKDAREHGIEGWVDLALAVTAAGKVASARVNDSENGRFFERAAMSAVKQWQYTPSQSADPAMTRPVRVRVSFRLED